MDFTTLTILAILSFILAWFGIMIFTTNPKEEEETVTAADAIAGNAEKNMVNEVNESSIQKVAKIAENTVETDRDVDVGMYRDLVEKYSNMVAYLKDKIDMLENPKGFSGVSNDKLIDWILDLRRENEYLKLQLTKFEGDKMVYEGGMGGLPDSQPNLKYENIKLKEKLDGQIDRASRLEKEIEEMKSGLNYYREIVNKLQGNYTVINKYNYRTCIRDPNTGEFQYELVKFPPDFDPFNPTYITRDGTEIYERFGIKIPTKLGDIVREEFRKSAEYWEEDTGVDWKLGR